MLRPRPALAALATVVAMALGSTAAVLTTHRPTTATGGTVVTTQLPDTTAPPTTTTSPSTGPKAHRPTDPAPQPPTTSPPIADPAQAARQLFQAWQAGDQQHARQAATPSAVRTLFAFTPTPKLGFAGCRFSSHGYDCFYTSTDVGLWYLDMQVEGGASAGYRVVSVNTQTRFGSPDAAARYVAKAWLENDRAKARRAASETVVHALWSRLGDRAYGLRFNGCTFRDINSGSDCAFGYTTVGLGFTMQVKGGANLGWQVVAIQFAQL
jgi:predicted lipid-binding transport protein (Tim44 family)